MAMIAAAFAGLVFGIGILVAGMHNPAKVINFFDVAGAWDPSLAFVMGGALTVTFVGYRCVLGWQKPLACEGFQLPPAGRGIDARLIAGAAIFGLGWGLAGFCPGGLVPVLAIGRGEPVIFAAGLLGGLVAARWWLMRRLGWAASSPKVRG